MRLTYIGVNKLLKYLRNASDSVLVRAILWGNDVVFAEVPTTGGVPNIINRGKLSIGRNVTLNSSSRCNPVGGNAGLHITVRAGAELVIGDSTGISNAEIFCEKGIFIGAHVFVGGGAKIYDTDFHSIHWKQRRNHPDLARISSPIVIEDDVFIGGGAYVMKGVTIGKGSVIGANSVVTKSVPPEQIWAGNPARFIRSINDH